MKKLDYNAHHNLVFDALAHLFFLLSFLPLLD